MEKIWLFDLDNTLHHADYGVFDLINQKMTQYLMEHLHLDQHAASDLRLQYWHQYGATLAGLEKHHPHIDIQDFLRASHPQEEIQALLVAEIRLPESLSAIAGRKFVFSNGPSFYVQYILEHLSLLPLFDGFFGCDAFDNLYKPNPIAYQTVCQKIGVLPQQCTMVDDSIANLKTAKQLGMQTILIGTHHPQEDFIDGICDSIHALKMI